MPEFNRFDVLEAHYQIEVDYNSGGWLHERLSNQRRREATHIQLSRMQFSVGSGWKGYNSLSENGKDIYHELRERYGFSEWDDWSLNSQGVWVEAK